MRTLIFLIFIGLIAISTSAQQEPLFLSEALSRHLPSYEPKADIAYRTQDLERADYLFDSLVQYCLKGSIIDNFKLNNLKKQEVYLEDFEKPVFLRTYASWLAPAEGEIPALNQMAQEHGEEIDFVLLFWDDHKTARRMSHKYDKNIQILYVDELQNTNPDVIRILKHSLGFPTTYLLDKDRQIVDIKRNLSHPYGIGLERSFALHYEAIAEGMDLLMLKKETQIDRVANMKL